MAERTAPPQGPIRNIWLDCSKIAIRVVENNKALKPPKIVCTSCDETLTWLADLDNVSSLITLAMEHTCPSPAP